MISPADLSARIERGDSPLILDVRSAREFAQGHVPGAVHVPFWRIGARLNDIPAKPDDEVVIYCGHGPRAMIARATLRRRGFGRLSLLTGHWARWVRERNPIVRAL